MSMTLLAGFIVAYPMNWWLVARHLKHGMATVRPESMAMLATESTKPAASGMSARAVPRIALVGMAILSLAAFAAGLLIAMWIAIVC